MFGIFVDGSTYEKINYSQMIFSGGEVQVKLDLTTVDVRIPCKITISAYITQPSHIMELMLVTDAVKRAFQDIRTLVLTCPYLPYARQDRVCDKGEALSISVFSKMLNSLKFDKVTVWDCHSPVSLALIDHIVNEDQSTFIREIVASNPDLVLVAPDAGAAKKTHESAVKYGLPMITAEKVRSVHDGTLSETRVHSTEHIGNKDFLILDDICDGGRTFIELAKVLKHLTDGKIFLYVTHGIFSKGLEVFDGLIDHIYVAKAFPNVKDHAKLTRIID